MPKETGGVSTSSEKVCGFSAEEFASSAEQFRNNPEYREFIGAFERGESFGDEMPQEELEKALERNRERLSTDPSK